MYSSLKYVLTLRICMNVSLVWTLMTYLLLRFPLNLLGSDFLIVLIDFGLMMISEAIQIKPKIDYEAFLSNVEGPDVQNITNYLILSWPLIERENIYLK